MAAKFVSMRNLHFLLYEVMQAQRLAEWPRFGEYDRESFDMMLDTAHRLSSELLFPDLRTLDQEPPRFEDGKVLVHPMVRQFLAQAGEGGWVGATFPYEQGGLQLPIMINTACNFMFSAANYSATAYLGLITGATRLILSFGSEELQETYAPAMLEGRWQGTMALTEPQAGSSLADVAVMAEPTDQGHYLISGQKIFISAGDHDAADNVVHLMLGRIKGAPAGIKGISLFVVPKLRPEGGELVPNDLATAGLFHKMGYRGCPIVQLAMGENGDCRGWLVGEPNKGLAGMFQMMNEARISVGKAAAAIASAAYYASLQYAQERLQGRPLGEKDPTQPQVPLIRHADIKRMLLMQRAVVEGALSLILQAAWYADLHAHGPEEGREDAFLLLDLITPVVKSYPSEMGVQATSAAMQILGGYGYTDEFPVEQLYRDMRIHPIHEGTTGIQGMDLLGRKSRMHQGRALELFLQGGGPRYRRRPGGGGPGPLGPAPKRGPGVAGGGHQGQARPGRPGRDGKLPVRRHPLSGDVRPGDHRLAVAQAGSLAAAAALEGGPSQAEQNFYQGKLATMRYFFAYELPKSPRPGPAPGRKRRPHREPGRGAFLRLSAARA